MSTKFLKINSIQNLEKYENCYDIQVADIQRYYSNGIVSHNSSIFEAIALCWTERKRGDSYKDFIRHGVDTAEIHLTATIRDEPIQFDISIIDKKGASPFQRKIHYKDHDYINSECTTLLESFDIDYLQHIMFSMQGENNITDLRPGERTKLLKRIFNFEFEAQLTQLNQLIEQEKQNMLVLKTKVDVLNQAIFTYETEERLLSPTEHSNIEQRIASIDDTIRAQEQTILLQAEVARRLEGLKTQGQSLVSRKHGLEKDIDSLVNTLARIAVDRGSHAQTINTLADPIQLSVLISSREESIETLTRLITQSRQHIQQNLTRLNEKKSSILELQTHIEAHKQGKCPQCGQATQPSSVPTLEYELQGITEEYTDMSRQQTKLEEDARVTERTIVQYQAEIPGLRDRIKNSATMRTQLETILKTLENTEQQTQDTLQLRKDTLKDIELQIVSIEQQIDEIAPTVTRIIPIDTLQTERRTLTTQLQQQLAIKARNEVVARKNIETKQKEDDNKKNLIELNRQQNTATTSLTMYQEAQHILEVDLPNYIIVKACSKLEAYINHFISEVAPDMVARLFQSRSGVEFFYSPNGMPADPKDWTSTKMTSGFERELLSTAWRVALAQAYNLHALMLDEIDSAASTYSSEKMFREIANLTGFKQLFIVSHKPEVVDILLQENDRVTAYLVQKGAFTRQ